MKTINLLKSCTLAIMFSVLVMGAFYAIPAYGQAVCSSQCIKGVTTATSDISKFTGATPANGSADGGTDKLNKLLKDTINGLSALALLIFVVSLIAAGYQYMTARDNASAVAAAKERIITVVITFVLFVFGFGILQWLVPGGIFN